MALRKNGLQNLSGWRESIEDDERSGRPKDATTDENLEIVHSLVMCDRRRDLRSIASEVGISFGAVQTILTDIMGMSKVSARWVPKMLTDDQKRCRLDIPRYEDDPGGFIDRVVTQDEKWGHHFDPESKMQSMRWKHPGSLSTSPKKFKRASLAGRVMASVFWDSQRVIVIDHLQQGRTINGAYYAAELMRLRLEIARKGRGKLTEVFCS